MPEGQSLRAVLAELDMKVRGLGQVDEANVAIDKYVRSTDLAASDTEKLRIKQQEAYETASRLGRQIRKLQKAEGDHERQIRELRLAMARAKDSAKEYGREIDKLEGNQTQAAATAGGTGRGGLVGSMRGAAGAITAVVASVAAAGAAIRGFTGSMRSVIETSTELDIVAANLSISTDALQEWQFVAERSGVETEDLERSFRRLARFADSQPEIFREIGVEVKNANDEFKSQEQIFNEVVEQLGQVEDQTRASAVSQKIFGDDAGDAMLTMIQQGDTIDDLKARFRELGGGLSRDVIDKGVEAGDATQEFGVAMTSLKGAIAKDVLPAFTGFVKSIGPIISSVSEFLSKSNLIEGVLYALATAMGVLALAMLPVSGPLLVIVAAFAALALVIGDVITAFEGGESVFGSFVESILEAVGIETTFQGFIERMGVMWLGLKAKVLDVVAGILGSVDEMQDALGVEVFSGLEEKAAGMREAANKQLAGARRKAGVMQEREQERMTQRASANVVRALRGNVDARQEIQINEATDAEGVRRVLDEANAEQRKKIMDMFPSLAEGDPEGEPA